jgi:RNase H-fold protein (predicted Holliday junction resolvase)
MNRTANREIRVLAIDPSTRGFGFAILEGPERLIDWGVKETTVDKNRRVLKLINDLIDEYQPNAIIVEDCSAKGSPSPPPSTRID